MWNKKNEKADLESFVIYDSKSESYGQPILSQNAFALIREYESQWQDMEKNKSFLATHPEDYTLFRNGSYSYKTGKIEPQNLESVIGFHEIKSSVMSRVHAQRQKLGLVPDQQQ